MRKIIREEIDDLQWVKDVPSQIPNLRDRATVSFEEFFGSVMREDEGFKEYLIEEGYWNEEENEWDMTPTPCDYEIIEAVEWNFDNSEWEYVTQETLDYELEYSCYNTLYVFKRKADNRNFGFTVYHCYHDGIEDCGDKLYERYRYQTWVWS